MLIGLFSTVVATEAAELFLAGSSFAIMIYEAVKNK